jgi:hypothetical protein
VIPAKGVRGDRYGDAETFNLQLNAAASPQPSNERRAVIVSVQRRIGSREVKVTVEVLDTVEAAESKQWKQWWKHWMYGSVASKRVAGLGS